MCPWAPAKTTAPGGQHGDVQAAAVGLVHDVVYVVPVIVLLRVGGIRTGRDSRTRGVAIEERQVALRVRIEEPIQFGDGDGLNRRA